MKVLVVEDELKMASLLLRGFRNNGHAADVTRTGEDAVWMAVATHYDAIVLDVMLPGIDGFETLAALRRQGRWTPVLMLTARDAVEDRIAGLDVGADDYLTKPFSFDEFLARVRALLRRGAAATAPILAVTDLTLDPATREVRRGGRRITLTAREYALLEYFLRNPGRVLTRPMLAEHVWGLDFDPESNIVDVYVGYLRRKIDGPGELKLLHTVRGAGYALRTEEP